MISALKMGQTMAVSKTRSTCMVLCVGAGVAVYHQYRKRYFASMFTKCPRESYEIATRDLPPSDAAAISVVQVSYGQCTIEKERNMI